MHREHLLTILQYEVFIFHLSARIRELLANCLTILSVMASSENDIFSSIWHKSAT